MPTWLVLGVVIALWAALRHGFRKALLPLPVARVFGRVQFFVWRWLVLEPLYPWVRPRPWKEVASGVFLGKCPLSRHVPEMRRLGVRRVLNMQDEYAGPETAYAEHGIRQLWLPVVDHYEPSAAQIHEGVEFLRQGLQLGEKVYVHCQGGHGRSAAVVFAHLALDSPHPLRRVNEDLSAQWRVRTKLHSQPQILSYLDSKKTE